MNREIPMEKEFSSEEQDIEMLAKKLENSINEGQEQADKLLESRHKLLQMIEDKKLESHQRQIQEQLGIEEITDLPES